MKSETHRLIPGGAHTYSKGDDQFPANAPSHIERGQGCRVWDRAGNEFLDWTSGLRAISLGYGVRSVNDAAIMQIEKGSNFGRPSYIETELAQDLVDLLPGTDMVKFAKNGSTVTTAAVKLARAYTGRDMVAICCEHPFFSYDDWFIGATVCDSGIPQAIKDLTVTFHYNDIASLEAQFRAHPGKIACVILEPATLEDPRDRFLHKVRDLCHANGAIFILDEMVTGFRWHLQGAQKYYDVVADLATFGKSIGNGFSVAVLAGRRDIMELGGLFHDKPRVFLISTTHGAENHSLAACREVLRIYREQDVVGHFWKIGGQLMEGLNEAARGAGLHNRFRTFGFPCNPAYAFYEEDGSVSMSLKTLFMQELVKGGLLMPYIAPSFAHQPADVRQTVDAAAKAFQVVHQAIDGGVDKFLEGPVVKPVFRRFN